VTVASSVHNAAPATGIQFDDLHFARPGAYSLFPCYGHSKLANILFTKEFARRHSDICSVAVHPGCVRTHITQNMHWLLNWLYTQCEPLLGVYMKSRAQGAYSTLHALLCDEASALSLPNDPVVHSGGIYFHGKPYRNTSLACSDKVMAQKLWTVSAKLTDLANRQLRLMGGVTKPATKSAPLVVPAMEKKTDDANPTSSPKPIKSRSKSPKAVSTTPSRRTKPVPAAVRSPKVAADKSPTRAKSPARAKSPRMPKEKTK
jgi:hypothetical protein